MARISRRKYAEIVAFLKATIKNPHMKHRTRMSACQQLDSIYRRAEWMELQALQRKARAEAAAEAQRTQDGPNPPQESAEQEANAEIKAVYDKLMFSGKDRADANTTG
jgi:hypothetical protein